MRAVIQAMWVNSVYKVDITIIQCGEVFLLFGVKFLVWLNLILIRHVSIIFTLEKSFEFSAKFDRP